MEIKISTNQILQLLNILSWIIFIGLCIQAGGFIFTTVYTLLFDPAEVKYLWMQVDLSNLYVFDKGYFLVEILLLIIVSVMKALMFYLIIKILHNRKLNMAQPFNTEVGRFIFNTAYITLAIGLFSYSGTEYSIWFVQQGVKMPTDENLTLGGADVWLFMSVILFVLAHIFKKGIEIQIENELTV